MARRGPGPLLALALTLALAQGPTARAHGQYSPLGDLLHFYAHAAGRHASRMRQAGQGAQPLRCAVARFRRSVPTQPTAASPLLHPRYIEITEPGHEHVKLPVATFSTNVAEAEPAGGQSNARARACQLAPHTSQLGAAPGIPHCGTCAANLLCRWRPAAEVCGRSRLRRARARADHLRGP